jgi:hypothetical protein
MKRRSSSSLQQALMGQARRGSSRRSKRETRPGRLQVQATQAGRPGTTPAAGAPGCLGRAWCWGCCWCTGSGRNRAALQVCCSSWWACSRMLLLLQQPRCQQGPQGRQLPGGLLPGQAGTPPCSRPGTQTSPWLRPPWPRCALARTTCLPRILPTLLPLQAARSGSSPPPPPAPAPQVRQAAALHQQQLQRAYQLADEREQAIMRAARPPVSTREAPLCEAGGPLGTEAFLQHLQELPWYEGQVRGAEGGGLGRAGAAGLAALVCVCAAWPMCALPGRCVRCLDACAATRRSRPLPVWLPQRRLSGSTHSPALTSSLHGF